MLPNKFLFETKWLPICLPACLPVFIPSFLSPSLSFFLVNSTYYHSLNKCAMTKLYPSQDGVSRSDFYPLPNTPWTINKCRKSMVFNTMENFDSWKTRDKWGEPYDYSSLMSSQRVKSIVQVRKAGKILEDSLTWDGAKSLEWTRGLAFKRKNTGQQRGIQMEIAKDLQFLLSFQLSTDKYMLVRKQPTTRNKIT